MIWGLPLQNMHAKAELHTAKCNPSKQQGRPETKRVMAGVLVSDLEQEIEKLKREHESLKLKRKREKATKEECKEPLRKPELFAELKYDDELGIDCDSLEELIEEHKEKLKRLEAEYYGQNKILAVKENESISYEELRNLRVNSIYLSCRRNMK